MIFKKKIQLILGEIITCDPSIYTMDHPDFIVCSLMENSIGLKWINLTLTVDVQGAMP